jgi:hypothetical protein
VAVFVGGLINDYSGAHCIPVSIALKRADVGLDLAALMAGEALCSNP